jgi:hypothetical protein
MRIARNSKNSRSEPHGGPMAPEKATATAWGLLFTLVLAVLIVLGSRNLEHFDAALVGYTFATLFATFGITYRYAMWLQRPPTRMYWRRGWEVFLSPKVVGRNLTGLLRRFFLEFAANRFIFRRGRLRGAAHWLIMWGCVIAGLITFPLVWGWIHFMSRRCPVGSTCTTCMCSAFRSSSSTSNRCSRSSCSTGWSGRLCSSSRA